MKTRWPLILAVVGTALPISFLFAQEADPAGSMEHLGDQRYRIGQIVVDRANGEFTVPGKILHLDDPLEYLAVTPGGHKEYESLLELQTTGREFNLACILIGLDEKYSKKPQYQFDENKPDGQRVAIIIRWQADEETRTVSGANALSIGDEVFQDESWIYTGSITTGSRREFMAHSRGTLIGFVHDPYNVIEHINGAGIGNYGIITGNNDLLPDEGTAVSLTVKVTGD